MRHIPDAVTQSSNVTQDARRVLQPFKKKVQSTHLFSEFLHIITFLKETRKTDVE